MADGSGGDMRVSEGEGADPEARQIEGDQARTPDKKSKKPEKDFLRLFERLAATYSRRTYRTTTIGKAVFDGRVRNGNGSDHSFRATKNWLRADG